ncbi:MAG TPA: PEP-CTERM sorting domain-containing protein [Bryobacteraceae bacterium]|nr:PEP-CTERM sorting domain-containing protein [Bryobacteraceae bacterium]
MRTLLATSAFAAAILLQTASAATLTVPSLTVLGTDVFSGPTFTVPVDYSPTDTLSFTVSGIVSLQGGGAFGTNAAGVVVVPGSAGVGQSAPNGSTTFGSLLLGNNVIPFVQLFATDASNGLGSANPPTVLAFSDTIGNIFGSGLSAGTVLEFRISDINTGDNGGQFSIRPDDAGAVPEPGSWLLAASGVALVAGTRLRRRVR